MSVLSAEDLATLSRILGHRLELQHLPDYAGGDAYYRCRDCAGIAPAGMVLAIFDEYWKYGVVPAHGVPACAANSEPRCECGIEAVGGPVHSDWCPMRGEK